MRSGKFVLLAGIGLALLAATSAIVLAAKPAPPPTTPPAIVYDLTLIPGLSGQVMDVNEAGDIIVFPDLVYIAALDEVSTANDWRADLNWSINAVYAMNNVGQIAVRAVYQGVDAEGFTPGVTTYYGLLDLVDGSFSPLFERPAISHTIEAINDFGEVCGVAMPGGLVYAFVASPAGGGPIYLFPDEIGLVASWARDINSAGQVVGYRAGSAFRYTPGEPTLMLSGLSCDTINEAGEFAGREKLTGKSTSERAVLYTDGAGVVALSAAHSLIGTGVAINEPGDVLWRQSTRTGMDPVVHLRNRNISVNLMASGAVQGSAANLKKWKSEDKLWLHFTSSRKIVGSFWTVDTQVFVLTPRP